MQREMIDPRHVLVACACVIVGVQSRCQHLWPRRLTLTPLASCRSQRYQQCIQDTHLAVLHRMRGGGAISDNTSNIDESDSPTQEDENSDATSDQELEEPPPPPFTSNKSTSTPSTDNISFSAHSIKGARPYMEDEYIAQSNFYAVFDGHGGKSISRYLKANLYANLQSALSKVASTSVGACALALKAALDKVDKEVSRISHWAFQGSTAVVVWIRGNKYITANIGDSRAILCRDGKAIQLTKDHKPDESNERDRIESLGGSVDWVGMIDENGDPIIDSGVYRINRNLAVSRAVGDRAEPCVSSEADIEICTIDKNDEYILVASDGLWDVMTNQETVDFISEHISNGEKRESMAKIVVKEALLRGSSDNITVLIIWLN